jgi:hypothetical protein
MATSSGRSRLAGAIAIVALALFGAAACGGSEQGPFAWLKSRPAPGDWSVARIPVGSALAYPPGWRTVRGDAGTATAALLGSDGRFLGYLNVTPRQGGEKLNGWASFRTAHNADEGDHDVKQLASATGLRFLDGRGTCVKDSYSTETGGRYVEIACIVQGASSSSVIVAAAPPGSWARVSPQLERAIEGFRA